jgi:hypothetical protein
MKISKLIIGLVLLSILVFAGCQQQTNQTTDITSTPPEISGGQTTTPSSGLPAPSTNLDQVAADEVQIGDLI